MAYNDYSILTTRELARVLAIMPADAVKAWAWAFTARRHWDNYATTMYDALVERVDKKKRQPPARFAAQIGWISDSVYRQFRLKGENDIILEDLEDACRVQIMRYADLIPGWGNGLFKSILKDHDFKSVDFRKIVARHLHRNLSQIVGRMLKQRIPTTKIDAIEHWNEEEVDSIQPTDDGFYPIEYNPGESLNRLPVPDMEDTDDYWENRTTDYLDTTYLERFARDFPFLAAQQLGHLSVQEIADAANITVKGAEWHITSERKDLLVVYEYDGRAFGEVLKRYSRKELRAIRQKGLAAWLTTLLSVKLIVEGDERQGELIEAAVHMFYERDEL